MSRESNHLVLIDGHHLMYRAFWAIPRTLTTSQGEMSNTTFGMASMLINIVKNEEPTHLAICFDAGEETFRHQENETYKEGRAETPDEFYTQIPRVMQLVDAFDFSSISDKQYEADDFLGTYAVSGAEAGMQVTIVTGDRDALQLATDKVRVAIPHKGYQQAEYLGPAEIEAKLGVRPDQVVDYKGLCGDSSDNLPGVQGIGPKTAAELLQKYDTMDGIYKHLDDIRPSVKAKLERDKEQAYFCRKMAQLVCDIPLPESLEKLNLKEQPSDSVIEFFREMEFTMLIKRFQALLESSYGQEHWQADMGQLVAEVFGGVDNKDSDQMTMF